MSLLDQKDPLPFVLNFTKPGATGDDPDRVDKEKTLQYRKQLSKNGLPNLAKSVHDQFIIKPDEDQVKTFGHDLRSEGHGLICGECALWDYAYGQELLLERKGAFRLQELLASNSGGVEWLGDWRKYGYCEVIGTIADFHGPKCQQFTEKRKGVFGRLLGGAWKRLRDI